MKFTLSWLKEHLDTSASVDEIAEMLTQIGLEVEGVENPGAALRDFIIAEVVTAEQHPDADRLRVTTVNTGKEKLQVVCGAPNCRAGMKGVFAGEGLSIPRDGFKLKKTKIRGQESNGMLCSISELMLGDESDGIIDLPADAPVGQSIVEYWQLDDPVIEINVTPNRGDCLGVYGIARDLAAAGLGKLIQKDAPQMKTAGATPTAVKIETDLCSLFSLRLIQNVKNGESPEWLKNRLQSIGARPLSALVDVTNFFTFDQGRPLHVFDADKVKGNLVLKLTKKGETLEALDEKTYTMPDGLIGIYDDSGLISLAGVMGGAATGVTEDTTNVLLESAAFDPVAIADAGRKLGIVSDARYRFERFVDPTTVMPSQLTATQMILDLCGGEAYDINLAGTEAVKKQSVAFDPNRVEDLAGVNVAAADSKNYLTTLGFHVDDKSSPWAVTPPTWRPDIEGSADLVEEVLRLVGYDNIPTTPLPKPETLVEPSVVGLDETVRKAKRQLASLGLNEAVTWSFLSEAAAERFGGQDKGLYLSNPISADLNVMRPNLLPNLLDAAQYNGARGQANVALFEVGPVFETAKAAGQSVQAAGVRVGEYTTRHWASEPRAVDVFDVKADVFNLLEQFGLNPAAMPVQTNAPAWYHPGRSGALTLGKTPIAYFGEIHPNLLTHYDLENVVMFEVLLENLPAAKKKSRGGLVISPYPVVERDFAFLVANDVTAEQLLKAVRTAEKSMIEDVAIFDVYKGKGVPDDQQSVALSVRLQPKAATLTEDEIEAISTKIIDAVSKATGASLRS